MNRFTYRSAEKELIDEPGIPFSDWEICLRELNTINTYLGGHAITTKGVEQLIKSRPATTPIVVCEIGCGGGDNLKAIHKWHQRHMKNVSFKYIGIDINEACIQFASQNCRSMNAQFICSDYRAVNFIEKPSIIFNSLFCHHFSSGQLVEMLRWMKQNSTIGFFINDLQRHPVAYYSIKWLTKAFSRSHLVINDAPMSVQRGFHKAEWKQLLHDAGIEAIPNRPFALRAQGKLQAREESAEKKTVNYQIQWMWAFRYLVLVNNE